MTRAWARRDSGLYEPSYDLRPDQAEDAPGFAARAAMRLMFGAAGPKGGPFTATSIAGCQVWVAGYKITGKVNNDTLTTWTDASGNTRDLTCHGSPVYKTAGPSSHPYVQFTSASSQYADVFWTQAQPITVIGVFRARDTTNSLHFHDGVNAGSGTCFANRNSGVDGRLGIFGGTSWLDTSGWTSTNVWTIVSLLFNGASSTIRINGTQYASGGTIGTVSPGGVSLGGSPVFGPQYSNCDWAEVAYYTGALSVANQQTAEAGLNGYYHIY